MAMKGHDEPIECAYVRSDVTEAEYFATPLHLGVSLIYNASDSHVHYRTQALYCVIHNV